MPDKLPELVIVGLGGQARVALSIARARGYEIKGFVDALSDSPGKSEVFNLPVLGGISALENMPAASVGVALGDNRVRRDTVSKVLRARPDADIVSLIHPHARCEEDVELARYVTVCTGAIICAGARISDGALINTGSIVEHECVLGEYCHICPGARLGGRVRVGDFTQIGIGASVIDKINIGSHCIIGAGAVVIHDIPDYATAVGVPAKVIKTSQPDK